MKEAKVVKLYQSITNIEDGFIEEAWKVPLKRKENPKALRWRTVAAAGLILCLCTAAGIRALMAGRPGTGAEGGNNAGCSNGFWGDADCTLREAHREDFSPEFSPEAEAAFAGVPGVLKLYRTLYNEWFLAEDMTDFSQALTEEIFYIVPGSTRGMGGSKEREYSYYTLDENGKARWGAGVSAPANNIVPYELCGLTSDIIEEDLAGVDYEDYIITQSARLNTVFVWARCTDGEDVFITYPSRPEFVGLENRGRYTLEEIRSILTEAWRRQDAS